VAKNLSDLDKEIESIKQKAGSGLELPDEEWIRQSGPFNSVQHFFDSSFQNFRELLYFTNITPTQRVLDYGCGLARLAIPLSNYLTKTEGSYCGVDADQDCIARNKRVFGHLPNFEFHHVDIYSKMYNRTGRDYKVLLDKDFGSPFNLVFLFSVFTHVLPEDCDFLLNFLGSQLCRPSEVFASFFLLNDETQEAINAGKAHRKFATNYGNVRIDNPNVPEGAVAYYESDIVDRLTRAGFSDIRIHYGKWRGNIDSWIWQDIIVLKMLK
jgi:SAM-dependent methyltransferase